MNFIWYVLKLEYMNCTLAGPLCWAETQRGQPFLGHNIELNFHLWKRTCVGIHQYINIVIWQYWRDWEISVYFEIRWHSLIPEADYILFCISLILQWPHLWLQLKKHLLFDVFDFVSISMNYLCTTTHIMTDRSSQLHNWRFLLSLCINQWHVQRQPCSSTLKTSKKI